MDVTGIILAGGKSRRMGTNKALLEIGGEKNMDRIVQVLREVTNTIYIAANEREPYEYLQIPIIADQVAGGGPLGGIQSVMGNSISEYYIVVACDLPFLSARAIRYMYEQRSEYDGVVPLIAGRIHPLLAVYRRSILPIVEEHIEQKNKKVTNIFSKLKIRYVEEKEFLQLGEDTDKLFFNMNHQEDYKKAIKYEE